MTNYSDFSRSNAQIIKYPIITDKATHEKAILNDRLNLDEIHRQGALRLLQ